MAVMKRIISLLAIVLVVVVGWTGVWLFAANLISRQADLLMAGTGSGSPSVACASFSVTGFPFRFDATCRDASLVDGDARFTLPEIKVTVLVYRPTHAIAFFKGPLHYSNAFFGSEQQLRWSQLQASVRLNGWRLARASVQAEDVSFLDTLIGDNLLASTPMLEFHILDMPEKHDADAGRAQLAVFARSEELTAPPLTIADGRATLEAEISQIPDDVRLWGDPQILRRWQSAAGRIFLNQLEADTKDTQINIVGEFSLTTIGKPEGDLTFKSSGLAERFGDRIPPTMRPLVFGNIGDDGSYTQKLSIREGIIFAGPAPLAQIGPLF